MLDFLIFFLSFRGLDVGVDCSSFISQFTSIEIKHYEICVNLSLLYCCIQSCSLVMGNIVTQFQPSHGCVRIKDVLKFSIILADDWVSLTERKDKTFVAHKKYKQVHTFIYNKCRCSNSDSENNNKSHDSLSWKFPWKNLYRGFSI